MMERIWIATATRVRVSPNRNKIMETLRNPVFKFLNLTSPVKSLSLTSLVAHTVHVINEQATADNRTHINPKIIKVASRIDWTLINRIIAKSIDNTTLYSVNRVDALESRTPS